MKRALRLAARPLIGAAALLLIATVGLLGLQAAGCDTSRLVADFTCRTAEQPSPEPSPTARPNTSMLPINVEIPAGSDCAGCHVKADGSVGMNPIPAIGHPLEGWSDCTACHTTARLVETAPGHVGIHEDQCLVCHTKSTNLPSPRPHPPIRNTGCFECHGKTAPLPDDMSHRSETTCWLCHRATRDALTETSQR